MLKNNRCDRCGAQAFVMVSKGLQLLNFCGHDYTVNADALIAQGFEIEIDDRHLINAKPSVSANAV